jgi:hypothetical protein
MDHTALQAKALAVMDEEPVADPEIAVEAEPVSAEPADIEPSEPKVLDFADDSLVRIKVDGAEQVVKYADFKEKLQKEAVWTQRQQALAQQRRELEAWSTQQAAELQRAAELISYKEQAFKQYDPLAKLQEALVPKPPAPNPNEIVTIGELKAHIERLETHARQTTETSQREFQRQLQDAAAGLKEQLALQQDAQQYTNHLQGVVAKAEFSPLKHVIPNFEQNLRAEVWKLAPQSTKEAYEFTEKVADSWLAAWKASHTTETQKADAKKAQARLEPAIGSDPRPKTAIKPGRVLNKRGNTDWAELSRRAQALIE